MFVAVKTYALTAVKREMDEAGRDVRARRLGALRHAAETPFDEEKSTKR